MGEVDYVALGMVAVGAAGILAARWLDAGREAEVLGIQVAVPKQRDSLIATVFAATVISGIYVGAFAPRSGAGVLWVWALVRLGLAWRDRRGAAA